MFSFEGNYQTKRVQTLARNDKVTATTIVQQTREERKKRELLRRQHQAAIKLQALVRGMLCRLATKRDVGLAFDGLNNELRQSALSNQTMGAGVELPEIGQSLHRLLRLLNWFCRDSPDKERLFSACRLMLSKLGHVVCVQWLSTDSPDLRYIISRTLLIVLRYLDTLRNQVPSAEYVLPVRLLEEVLTTSDGAAGGPSSRGPSPEFVMNRVWLCRFLGRNHYFRTVAQFVDNQLPPDAGFLRNSTADSPAPSAFDPDEYSKIPQARELLRLLWAPITVIQEYESTGHAGLGFDVAPSTLLADLSSMALNDILAPDNAAYFPGERIVRGIGMRLLDISPMLELIPHLCLTELPSDGPKCGLIPSLNLLYLLATAVVPKLVSVDCPRLELAPTDPTEHTSSTSDSTMEGSYVLEPPIKPVSSSLNGQTAAELVRSTAWLLARTLYAPGSVCIRPLRTPKPLTRPTTDNAQDSSDDEEDFDKNEAVAAFPTGPSSHPTVYSPTWPTQLSEILLALRQTLPTLAASALSTLPSGSNANSVLSSEQNDLVSSLALLHYALVQVYGLPPAALITLNCIYSQHPVLIRALWSLVQQSVASSSARSSLQLPTSGLSLLRLLSAGELPEKVTDLQNYLPLLFTFTTCLNHRLMCLTDTEIGGSVTVDANNSLCTLSGCGFHAAELIQVGLQLRDLMLGLIELSHPDQLPNCPNTDLADRPNRTAVESDEEWVARMRAYREVFERLEQRAEAASLRTTIESDMLRRQRSGWSPADLRVQLQCWTDLFRQVQRLVFQIYNWDRRTHRHHYNLADSDMVANRLANFSSGQSESFWVKSTIATSVETAFRLWLTHGGDRGSRIFAGIPFGYHSLLNPDRDRGAAEPLLLSSREVRQVLILKEIPFVVPFERRVRLFQQFVELSRATVQGSYVPHLAALATYSDSLSYPDVSILVRRTHLYDDAFYKLSKDNEPNLRPRLRVRFMNQVGAEEAGVDGGGLSREFLSELIRDGFDPNRGYFVYTTEKTLYPNPEAAALADDYLKHYYFLGRVLSKALYEGMIVELRFAHFFLAKVVSRSGGGVGFDYLQSLDPELYRQLKHLKTYTDDVRNLMLDFTVAHSTFGESKIVELKPNGRHIPVTNENRVEYVHLVAHYKLNRQIYPQARAFIAGLNDVICIEWLRLFDADELQTLISGADTPIDIDDLERHTVYTSNSEEHQETVRSFWTVLRSFSEQDKRLFLRFVTACSRPPMFGFRDLIPPFSIQITPELERLPTASTCINLLRLPNFGDPEVIRERLLYALHSNAGFEYS